MLKKLFHGLAFLDGFTPESREVFGFRNFRIHFLLSKDTLPGFV
jgi:hypothetical protein